MISMWIQENVGEGRQVSSLKNHLMTYRWPYNENETAYSIKWDA